MPVMQALAIEFRSQYPAILDEERYTLVQDAAPTKNTRQDAIDQAIHSPSRIEYGSTTFSMHERQEAGRGLYELQLSGSPRYCHLLP